MAVLADISVFADTSDNIHLKCVLKSWNVVVLLLAWHCQRGKIPLSLFKFPVDNWLDLRSTIYIKARNPLVLHFMV